MNRVGADGQPRPLHIDQGIAATDFDRGPVSPTQGEAFTSDARRLVSCDKFIWDRCEMKSETHLGGDDRFHVLAVVEGAVALAGDPTGEPLVRGQSALLPAAAGPVACTPTSESAVLLDAYLP